MFIIIWRYAALIFIYFLQSKRTYDFLHVYIGIWFTINFFIFIKWGNKLYLCVLIGFLILNLYIFVWRIYICLNVVLILIIKFWIAVIFFRGVSLLVSYCLLYFHYIERWGLLGWFLYIIILLCFSTRVNRYINVIILLESIMIDFIWSIYNICILITLLQLNL
jgi:hypothetical protein